MMRARGIIEVYLIVGLVAFAGVGLVVYKAYSYGYDSAKQECAEAAEKVRKAEETKSGAASTGREKDREKTRVVYRTITQSVDKVVERPVYRNVCLDDDGLRLANAALSGALSTAREPDDRVPKAAPAPGR